MSDFIFTALAAQGMLRVIGAQTTELVNEASKIHKTSPVATAALGRVLTGAVLLSKQLKNEKDSLTIQFKGKGPIGGVVAVCGADAYVRGYVENPFVDLPLNNKGKLDVGGAVGKGFLSIIKDMGLKEPYMGTIPLVSGEIAEDLAYYLASSEQIPSVVSLGVLVGVDKEGNDVCFKENEDKSPYVVKASGGYILQLMPGADNAFIEELERRVAAIPPVTWMLSEGVGMIEMIEMLLKGYDMTTPEILPCGYRCNCSREKVKSILVGLGKKEILDIINEQSSAEISCRFCDVVNVFEKEELQELYENM